MKQQNLSEKDLVLLEAMGISEEQVREQLAMFAQGTNPILIERPATINDGIVVMDHQEKEDLVDYYSSRCGSIKTVKFVPASGAASRMFKTLQKAKTPEASLDPTELNFLDTFKDGLKNKQFAFHQELHKTLKKQGIDLEAELTRGEITAIITALLVTPGLNYAHLPKALIKFHHYEDYTATPLDEHLSEGIAYARDNKDQVHLHFTISPEFQERVKEYIASRYNREGIVFHIKFSQQKPSTNTITVDESNILFRDNENNLVPWPAGHGALIENLNEIDADIVFIKNIDNVVPSHLHQETVRYKKILGGYLLKIQKKTFHYLKLLSKNGMTPDALAEMTAFANESLNISFPGDFESREPETKRLYLLEKLNRPIRVCGMVQNEGEPGGGPFWARSKGGTFSLQIVESTQIDKHCPRSRSIMASASHFNPVDLVCGIKDFRGNAFDLPAYRDPNSYFITSKSKEGRSLKAIELPGLWNGAMAYWNTIFVEVPIATFNPVKTVNDLLRSTHQPQAR